MVWDKHLDFKVGGQGHLVDVKFSRDATICIILYRRIVSNEWLLGMKKILICNTNVFIKVVMEQLLWQNCALFKLHYNDLENV